MSDIEKYLETTLSANYAANTDLADLDNANGTYTLSWEWTFDRDDASTPDVDEGDPYDAADTFLGNLAAGTIDAKDAGGNAAKYCLDVEYELSITVTQID